LTRVLRKWSPANWVGPRRASGETGSMHICWLRLFVFWRTLLCNFHPFIWLFSEETQDDRTCSHQEEGSSSFHEEELHAHPVDAHAGNFCYLFGVSLIAAMAVNALPAQRVLVRFALAQSGPRMRPAPTPPPKTTTCMPSARPSTSEGAILIPIRCTTGGLSTPMLRAIPSRLSRAERRPPVLLMAFLPVISALRRIPFNLVMLEAPST
jgi:hypothetical protein